MGKLTVAIAIDVFCFTALLHRFKYIRAFTASAFTYVEQDGTFTASISHGRIANLQHDELTCENEVEPEDPVVDSDHDNDGAPEGHEGGEEGVGEVGVEHAQARVLADC